MNHRLPPDRPARSMRWTIDPRSLDRSPPPPPRKPRARRRLLLLSLVTGLAALAWWAARPAGDDAGQVVVLTTPVPIGQAAPPSPAASQPEPAAEATTTQAIVVPDDEAEPEASEPSLLSDDTNLSFARRAGLHRAPNPLQLTASAALAIDLGTGEVLHARNDQEILPVASLTKLVTAMVLLDSKVPLAQRIEISADDVDTLRYSRSRLPIGTRLTRDEALHLALMSSENRAAHALARTHPEGLEGFVRQMNAKMRQLGAAHATFEDPTGLSNANRATARDVAAIITAAGKYPLIRKYSTDSRHDTRFGKQRLTYLNSNRLVRHDRWPIAVQKTGYIVEAGFSLAMTMRVSGRPVAVVLLDAGSRGHRDDDARKLQRWLATRAAAR